MAGVALGGRLCVLGPREVSRGRGRQGTGGLQLNREASSVSRWGTQLRPPECTPVSRWPSTLPDQELPAHQDPQEAFQAQEQPRKVKCHPIWSLNGTNMTSKAAGTPREGLQSPDFLGPLNLVNFH